MNKGDDRVRFLLTMRSLDDGRAQVLLRLFQCRNTAAVVLSRVFVKPVRDLWASAPVSIGALRSSSPCAQSRPPLSD